MSNISRSYIINGKSITITTKLFDEIPNSVYCGKFRKEINTSFINAHPDGITTVDEFYENIEFYINHMQGCDIDKQSLGNALKAKCDEHIQHYGRLIDADLQLYTDCLMFVTESMSKVFYGSISPEQGELLREEFDRIFYKLYYKYIWVNKRVPIPEFPFYRPELVKLSEM